MGREREKSLHFSALPAVSVPWNYEVNEMKTSTALIPYSPAAAAFSRLVTEGANSQAVNQARQAGLTVGEVKLAWSVGRGA